MAGSLHRWLGFRAASAAHARAHRRERLWHGPVLAALLLTIPAFYLKFAAAPWAAWAAALYALAALALALQLAHVCAALAHPARHAASNWLQLLLIGGLLAAAAAPASATGNAALALRVVVAFGVLLRLLWSLRALFSPRGVLYLLGLAGATLAVCGAGFYWLEPQVHSFGEGLWLAFTTAATVGYGDLVPTTTQSRIFAVFVVLLGFAVLSLATGAVAAIFVQSDERQFERAIERELRDELSRLRAELAALREALDQRPMPSQQAAGPPPAAGPARP
jgi:voltage-gated potassium channel